VSNFAALALDVAVFAEIASSRFLKAISTAGSDLGRHEHNSASFASNRWSRLVILVEVAVSQNRCTLQLPEFARIGWLARMLLVLCGHTTTQPSSRRTIT
jgi:hypothetical protein